MIVLGGIQWIKDKLIFHLLTNSFQPPLLPIRVWFFQLSVEPRKGKVTFIGSLITNELNQVFDTCSFYICLRVMTLLKKKFFL